MQLIPIKTKVFQPPQDDLFSVLDEVLEGKIEEGDIIAITSKVVSISEGRCVPVGNGTVKPSLKLEEADYYLLNEKEGGRDLFIRAHAFISAAGIDESNGNEHYILLPKDAMQSARELWVYIREKWDIKNLGLIITDSRSLPLRHGSTGVAIGYAGFKPTKLHKGEKDLFGRAFHYTNVNHVDALAAAAVLVMGETTEQTPLCIVRNAPQMEFTDVVDPNELFVSLEEDIYYPLLKDFKKNPKRE